MPARTKKSAIEQSSDSSSYEVEKILQKKVKNGKQLYKVVWKGYPVSEATWQPRSNMNNCSQLILEFQLNLLSEQDKAEMVNAPLHSKQDISDEVQNSPMNIYESNLHAVCSSSQVQHIKRTITALDKLIRAQSRFPEGRSIKEVVQAQEISQHNQPSCYKVRLVDDKRYLKVSRDDMLENAGSRVKLIEYYQKLGWKK